MGVSGARLQGRAVGTAALVTEGVIQGGCRQDCSRQHGSTVYGQNITTVGVRTPRRRVRLLGGWPDPNGAEPPARESAGNGATRAMPSGGHELVK